MRTAIVVALLVTLATADPWNDAQVRLAFLPDGMTVSWTSKDPIATPTVRWGEGSFLDRTATGAASHTYGSVHFSDVLIRGLKPRTQYSYQILGLDRVGTFTTAMAPGDGRRPFTAGIIGDMGMYMSVDVHAALLKDIPNMDFILHLGDISYADDWYLHKGDTYEGVWNTWMSWMTPITSATPYMVLPGNHEATCTEATPFICPAHERNFTAYRHRYRMPSPETGGVENMWYSFDYGLVHFIQVSTETDFPNAPENPGTWLNAGPFGDQMAWLEKDLAKANANRANVPFIIMSGHRPWFGSASKCAACKAAFLPLVTKYKIDMLYFGHVHAYERLWPVTPDGKIAQKSYINPTAPIYITNGAGGNLEEHSKINPQEWTAFSNDKDYGYGLLTVHNRTTIEWKFKRASDMAVVDSFFLRKAQ